MEPKKYSDQIIEKIDSKDIKPKPKWTFLLKDYVMWGLGILSLLIGGLAFSAVIFIMRNNDWDVYMHFNSSLFKYFFLTAPYLWIVLLILFILAAHYNYTHTNKGYKYEIYKIVIAIILISSILGVFFYKVGIGQAIDEGFAKKSQIYQRMLNNRHQRWNQPAKGFLSGQVTKINGEIKIQDHNGKIWTITPPDDIDKEKLKRISKNMRLRFLGEKLDDGTFKATEILPWMPAKGKLPLRR